MRGPGRAGEGSFALVSSLLIVAVMALGALAFFQAARLDRLVTRSTADTVRAQLAAESGLAAAAAILYVGTTNDHFLIVGNSSRQLFIGDGSKVPAGSGPGVIAYQPLFSSATSLPSLFTTNSQIVTAAVPASTAVGTTNQFVFQLPGGSAVTSPVLNWLLITNSQGRTNARFAFWVEDLAGRLDLTVAGSAPPGPDTPRGTANLTRRPTGMLPGELALWSVFSPSNNFDPSNATAVALASNSIRSSMLTPASARLVNSNTVTPGILSHFAAGLIHDTNEPEIIPYGFGYADEGNKKYRLAPLVTQTNLGEIIRIITNNLPTFGQRGGGLGVGPYLTNLAANIIDFVDENTTMTIGDGYRGVEPIPLLNERVTRYRVLRAPYQVGTRWILEIETTEYLEFWNLFNRTSPTVSVIFNYRNIQPIQFGALTNLNVNTNVDLTIPAVPPNGYFVTDLSSITNQIVYEAVGEPDVAFLVGGSTNVIYSFFQTRGNRYDRGTACNISDITRMNDPTRDPYFSLSFPSLGSKFPIPNAANNGSYLSTHGDPRGGFYMTNPQFQQNYERNSSFGGRNKQHGNPGRANSEVNIFNWPDNGHNDTAGPAVGDLVPPPNGITVDQPNMAPARVNPLHFTTNISRSDLINIAHLGLVFDPIQWADLTQRAYGDDPRGGTWTNLTANASADSVFAGGTTLRIGRAEFTRFTNNGLRAAQLLDLFASGTNYYTYDSSAGGGSGSPSTNLNVLVQPVAGRINLNTATTDTLRALAAGVIHTNDPAIDLGATYGVVPIVPTNSFVQGVINFRAQQPFLSTSQLNDLTNSSGTYPNNAVFGNRNFVTVGSGTNPVSRWADAAAEEWFSKIHRLSTVRSRNFLVYVVGQAMSTSTNSASRPLATQRKVFQIYMEPQRDAQGNVTNCVTRVLQTWNL